MRSWALYRVQALNNRGFRVRVLNFIPWIPRWVAVMLPGIKAWARCPRSYEWEPGIHVEYRRFPFYRIGFLKQLAHRRPAGVARCLWPFVSRLLYQEARKTRPDLIYAVGLFPASFFAAYLAMTKNLPLAGDTHSLSELQLCKRHASRRRALGRLFSQFAVLIMPSERMAKITESLWPSIHPRVIRNGIPRPSLQEQKNKRSEWPRDNIIIFSCGTFLPRKGFSVLIEAFAHCAAQHPKAQLRIAGDGQEKPAAEAQVSRYGLEERIHFLGRLSHERILQEMGLADAFALVSWDEPFATVFIEAMATGTPIVYAADGGINEVVTNGREGWSVEPRSVKSAASALADLLADANTRREMGQAAKKLYEQELSIEAFGRQLEQSILEACRQGTDDEARERLL